MQILILILNTVSTLWSASESKDPTPLWTDSQKQDICPQYANSAGNMPLGVYTTPTTYPEMYCEVGNMSEKKRFVNLISSPGVNQRSLMKTSIIPNDNIQRVLLLPWFTFLHFGLFLVVILFVIVLLHTPLVSLQFLRSIVPKHTVGLILPFRLMC